MIIEPMIQQILLCHRFCRYRLNKDGAGLQSSLVGRNEILSLHFEHLAEAALADEAGDGQAPRMGSYYL